MATLERKLGRHDGIRYAITWLHTRAKTMNDPTAVAVLNVAASDLGNHLSRFEVVPPEGYVLVPKEPTPGMLNAMIEADAARVGDTLGDMYARQYRAAISASPLMDEERGEK